MFEKNLRIKTSIQEDLEYTLDKQCYFEDKEAQM